MKDQPGEKSLEAPENPYLLMLREQTNVFPFDLQDRPGAYTLGLFQILGLACNAMLEHVDRDPCCLDRGKAFFAAGMSAFVCHLSRLPDCFGWHHLRPHAQVEPESQGRPLYLSMDQNESQDCEDCTHDEA